MSDHNVESGGELAVARAFHRREVDHHQFACHWVPDTIDINAVMFTESYDDHLM